MALMWDRNRVEILGGFLRRLLERGVKGVGERGDQEEAARANGRFSRAPGETVPRLVGRVSNQRLSSLEGTRQDPLVLESPL